MTEDIVAIVRMNGKPIDNHVYTVKKNADQAVSTYGESSPMGNQVRAMLNYTTYLLLPFSFTVLFSRRLSAVVRGGP